MMPFLFRVERNGKTKFIVKQAKYFDYRFYDSSWMDDPLLGAECLVPDADVTEEVFEFDTERGALLCMQSLWADMIIK